LPTAVVAVAAVAVPEVPCALRAAVAAPEVRQGGAGEPMAAAVPVAPEAPVGGAGRTQVTAAAAAEGRRRRP
jgi:hypothetical protein